MRLHRIRRICGAVLMVLGVLVTTLSMSAGHANATPNPVYLWRFGTSLVCVNDHTGGGSQWPIGTVAAEYGRMAADMNFVVDYDLGNGCDGFSSASTVEVWYYQGTDPDNCGSRSLTFLPDYPYTVQSASFTINLNGGPWCKSTLTRRANVASQLLGEIIGLQLHHNGNRSVMSDTDWTHNNIGTAQISDGQTIDNKMPW